MPKALTEHQLARYRDDGCHFPLRLFSNEEASGHRTRLEAAEAAHGPLHYKTKPYLFLTSPGEIARCPVLLDAIEDLIGPDILLWDSAYVIKEPRDTRFVSWHQDLTYWGLSGTQVVTAWVAIGPSTPENGCMRFLPGTHREGKVAHQDTNGADNILHRGQKIAEMLDESRSVDIVLRPGECSLHHGWVMHGSAANHSDQRRIGLTLQYIAPSVRQTLTDRDSATLVRGQDRHGYFRPEPACRADFDPSAVAFQQEIERLRPEVYDNA